MDETTDIVSNNNDELQIVEVDAAIVEAERDGALVEVDAGKTGIAAFFDAVEKAVPEIVKWKERGEMVRLDMPLGFKKDELLKGRGYARKLACQGKDGKFVGTATITELSKAGAVANVFGIAAYVVGQQQMAEMNKRLESIESSLSKIVNYLEKQQRAEIMGNYKALRRYLERADEYLAIPEVLQAARQEVERIRNESIVMWETLMSDVRSLTGDMARDNNPKGKKNAKRLDAPKVKEKMEELSKLEERAALILEITCLSSQLKAQFNEGYAERSLEGDAAEVMKLYDEYAPERQKAIEELGTMVGRVKGRVPIVIAEDRSHGEFRHDLAPVEAVVGGFQKVTSKTGKVNPKRMHEAKLERDEDARHLLTVGISGLEADDKPRAAADRFENGVENDPSDEPFCLLYSWKDGKLYMVPHDDDAAASEVTA